jgi:anthranilate phosphoribosyltransferase
MIFDAIQELLAKKNLTQKAARGAMLQIMEGKATDAQIAAFLTALRMKGETVGEITACAQVLREKCVKLKTKAEVLDIVGTGGDGQNTFNISTAAAFVVAAAGIPVAKHGNRAMSGKCGSADVMEALGANITLNAEQSAKVLEEAGVCFMPAQSFHPAMRHVAKVRRELAARTIFNILGPLTNPAGACMQLFGVYDENLVEPLADVLKSLGAKRAMVVHGDGLDEVTLTGSTTVCELRDGKVYRYFITPEQFGFKRCLVSDLAGAGAEENAAIARRILSGQEKGPKRDVVVLNAACCLYMVRDNVSLADCVKSTEELIDSGKAAQTLEAFIRAANEVPR